MCGCAQSHMYKVAYVLPLISEKKNQHQSNDTYFNGNEVGHYIAQARRFIIAATAMNI